MALLGGPRRARWFQSFALGDWCDALNVLIEAEGRAKAIQSVAHSVPAHGKEQHLFRKRFAPMGKSACQLTSAYIGREKNMTRDMEVV